jgi:hypothetical protein
MDVEEAKQIFHTLVLSICFLIFASYCGEECSQQAKSYAPLGFLLCRKDYDNLLRLMIEYLSLKV